MISDPFDDFNKKFNVYENLVAVSDYWRLSVRPHQTTLGSMILSLDRYCPHFSDITSEEAADLKEIISFAEEHLKKAFNYDKINYLMMMMVDPHVHFHVIPRYSEPVSFAGVEWVDNKWPTPADLNGDEISGDMAEKIVKKIKG